MTVISISIKKPMPEIPQTPINVNLFPPWTDLYFFFPPLDAPLRWERSEAATSFSFLVDFGLLRILPASDAAFFPVVTIVSFVSGRVKIYYPKTL